MPETTIDPAAPTPPTLATPAEVVERFFRLLAGGDATAATKLLATDVVYENKGLPTVHGRARTERLFGPLGSHGLGFDAEIHRLTANGNEVMTERTDALYLGPVHMQFWVCGVHTVKDGQITLWRDYFDFVAFGGAAVRGVVGAVIPSLRPRLR